MQPNLKPQKMRHIILALAITSGLVIGSCNSGNSGNPELKGGTEKVSNSDTGNSTSASTSDKPEFLTKETFLTKVWNFEKNPQEWVYEGDTPAIIDFYADWCRPCKMVAPILDELAKDYKGKVKIYKIDTQKERELAAVFNIQSIPAFLYIPANGKPQMDMGFKDKAAFEQIIKTHLLNN